MIATAVSFLEFLRKSSQFIIPIYQRTYSWKQDECAQLWEDIIRTGSNDKIPAHFTGSIVYIQESHFQVAGHSPLLVIDGQQRLTTIMLILEALARALGTDEPIDGFSAKKVRSRYLLDTEEDDERRFKLLLTQTDKKSLIALMRQKPEPEEASVRIAHNFAYFEKQVRSLGSDRITELCRGLQKLMIVDVSLTRGQDNPQLIFESLNSTGRELSQADLIRNFVLMGLDTAKQTRLYEDHWRRMEIAFGQEAYGVEFDGFMRHYLTFKTGEIPNIRAVYEAFKKYAQSSDVASAGIDALVADIHTFADYYCAMALGREQDKELAVAFQDIRDLEVDVAFPLLLELYNDFALQVLSKDDFVQAVRFIESYVFRRAVCAIPTNSLNKTFATFGRVLRKERYLECIKAHLMLLPSYRRFPGDEEFSRELCVRDLYNFRRRSYWLRRIENHDRKERVAIDEYTIEHILPQNEALSETWREALGANWKKVQEKWLHTLGNLTLTGYNAEYGDRSFPEKRDMKGGFRESPLRLNAELGKLDRWTENTIRDRARRLSLQAIQVWPAPWVPDEVLVSFHEKQAQPLAYTLQDHNHLASKSPMRPVFEAFRKAVLALDPGIREEILKVYIAYKAETNFVDVVPLKRCLCLTLNLRFIELHDPKSLARDVTNLGRWGNGDAEVELSELDDLPYVMGLVRQAFERQMGNSVAGD